MEKIKIILFIIDLGLLTTYLNFIPLSGGQLFPSVLNSILDFTLDVGTLTASLGFSTNQLSTNVRKLEEMSKNNHPDTVRIRTLNILAKQTLGAKSVKNMTPKKPIKSPRKPKQSVLKPRSNKIFQARTNIARMNRMKEINEADSNNLIPELDSFHKENEAKIKNVATPFDYENKEVKIKDLEGVRKRLHNLELLATYSDGKVDMKNVDSDYQLLTMGSYKGA